MKPIQECFSDSQTLNEYLQQNRVDEGLKEFIGALKTKFKQVVSIFGNIVARVGDYFASFSEDGQILPVNAPVNLGVAYKNGAVDRSNTLVVLPPDEARVAKISTKITDAFKLYGSGNSLQWWKQQIRESKDDDAKLITESEYINGEKNYIKKFIEEFGDNSGNSKAINEVKLEADDPEAVYNRIVDEAELRDVIKEHIDPSKKLSRLLIWGAPGIGKTATLAAIVNEIKATSGKEYRCIVKTLSNETPDNFTLPAYTDDVEQIGEDDFADLAAKLGKPKSWLEKTLRSLTKTAYDVPKTWLPVYKPSGNREIDKKLDEKCGCGLLFIDELSRATPQVLNVVLPLINEGCFNGYVLGSGWSIIAASNRMADDEVGQQELGTALSNRFAHVYFEPTVHSWRKWAEQQGYISPLLLSWLSLPAGENISGGKFYYMDPNEENPSAEPTQLICTPRSWTNAMRALATYSHTGTLEKFTIFDIDERVIKKVLNRYIPKVAIDSFMGFLDVISKVGGDFQYKIDEMWRSGKSPFGSDEKKVEKTMKQLGMVSIALAQLIVTTHKEKLPTTEEFVNLCKFLSSTNSDQLVSCVLDVFMNVFFSNITDPMEREDLMIAHLRVKPSAKEPVVPQGRINYINNLIAKAGYGNLDSYPDFAQGLRIVRANKTISGVLSNHMKFNVEGEEAFA